MERLGAVCRPLLASNLLLTLVTTQFLEQGLAHQWIQGEACRTQVTESCDFWKPLGFSLSSLPWPFTLANSYGPDIEASLAS